MTRLLKLLAAVGAVNILGVLGSILLVVTIGEAFGQLVAQAAIAVLLLWAAWVFHTHEVADSKAAASRSTR